MCVLNSLQGDGNGVVDVIDHVINEFLPNIYCSSCFWTTEKISDFAKCKLYEERVFKVGAIPHKNASTGCCKSVEVWLSSFFLLIK